MKKYFIITLLATVFYSGYSQFINKNAVWTTRYNCFDNGLGSCTEDYYYFESYFNKDTLINDTLYNILDGNGDREVQFIREDSINHIVYYRQNDLEYKLYDFDLEEGDTFPTKWGLTETYDTFFVTKVDSITITGEKYKRIELNNGFQIWVENIGSSISPFWPDYEPFEHVYELYCYKINTELIYGNCKTVKGHEILNEESDIQISCKNHNIIFLSNKAEGINYKLFSINGEMLMEGMCYTNELIPIQENLNGIFVIRINNATNEVCTEKIILN